MDLDRARYAQLYGPTVGDRIRLADTDLLIEVTEDLAGGPGRAGDEAVFGGGKVLRESMGQGRATRADGSPTSSSPARSCSTTGGSSRRTSGSGRGGSSRSARPATPRRWTACTRRSSSAPAPR